MFIVFEGHKIQAISKTIPSTSSYIPLPANLSRLSLDILKKEYEVVNNSLVKKPAEVLGTFPLSGSRIALVTSFGENCGMSTYSSYLVSELKKHAANVHIFAEMSSAGNTPDVTRCWDRAKGDYSGILENIKAYKPDIIFVQHEYGSFSNPVSWNMMIGNLSARWRTIVALHSVYAHQDKLVFEAPCTEIIVHSKGGRDLLRKKGIDHCPVHYIPHGCIPQREMDLKYSSMNEHQTLFQFGFGFEYKGWSSVQDIVKNLKGSFPDISYIGIFNFSKFYLSFHEKYFSDLMQQIEAKGLQDSIILHKGFRSEDVLFSYMKQSKVNIFPYWNHQDWLVYGASGAVRLALASGTPTVVGRVPFFYEFDGYLPICDTVEEYTKEIEKILKDSNYKKQLQDRMAQFIEERSWSRVAAWYLSVTKQEDFTPQI